MPLRNGETFAGSRIVRPLGSGEMGEVYLAEHPRLPRRDAIKVLPTDVSADAEYGARFNREADLASTHDRGEYSGQLWISSSSPCDRPNAGQVVMTRREVGDVVCSGDVSTAVAAAMLCWSVTALTAVTRGLAAEPGARPAPASSSSAHPAITG